MDVSQEFIQKWHCDSVPMMKSSGDAITEYLRHAKTTIDAIFGDGYARKNPVLVGQIVLACNDSLSSANSNSCLLAIDASINRLAEEISTGSNAIDRHYLADEKLNINESIETIAEKLSDIAESLDYLAATKPDKEV